MIMHINEERFRQMLQDRLGPLSWERALKIFHGYGEKSGYHVLNIILHGLDKRIVDKALDALEHYFESPVANLFDRIYADVLGMPQTPKGWSPEAKKFLDGFYAEHKAVTTQEKIAAIEKRVGKWNVHSNIPEQILGCYEYQILEQEGLIELTLC